MELETRRQTSKQEDPAFADGRSYCQWRSNRQRVPQAL